MQLMSIKCHELLFSCLLSHFIKMQIIYIWNTWIMIKNMKKYLIQMQLMSIWNTWIMIKNIKTIFY